jgi:hypothetical protein
MTANTPDPPISWYEEASHRQQHEDVRETGFSEVLAILRESQPQRWLDFGCSAGALIQQGAGIGEPYGFDNDEVAVQVGRERGLRVTSNWDEVPQVEFITALDVVEHLTVDELIAWMKRWHERLAEGGRALVVTANPANLTAMSTFWDDWQHQRPYGPKCLIGLAATVGFETERLVFRQQRTLNKPFFRLVRKALMAIGLWPDPGNDFASYMLLLRKVAAGGAHD